MEEVFFLVIDIFFAAVALWLAGKITQVEIELKETILIAFLVTIVGIIPIVGFILSFIALFALLNYFTSVNIYPDLILMFIVSKLLSLILSFAFADIYIKLFS